MSNLRIRRRRKKKFLISRPPKNTYIAKVNYLEIFKDSVVTEPILRLIITERFKYKFTNLSCLMSVDYDVAERLPRFRSIHFQHNGS